MSEVTTKNKQTTILDTIRAGGATRESLMEAANVNKAGLASQLAYLNSRGQAMAEVDRTKAEFPLINDNGVFYMGNIDEYEAKRKAFGAGVAAKPRSRSEVLEAAQKREDKASAAYSKAKQKADDNPGDVIHEKAAQLRLVEMELASLKLSRVEAGDFSYESGTIVEDSEAPAKARGKKGKAAPAEGAEPGAENGMV